MFAAGPDGAPTIHSAVSRTEACGCGLMTAVIVDRCPAAVNVTTSVPGLLCATDVVKSGEGTADTRHTALAPNRTAAWPPWERTVCVPAPPWQPAAGAVTVMEGRPVPGAAEVERDTAGDGSREDVALGTAPGDAAADAATDSGACASTCGACDTDVS